MHQSTPTTNPKDVDRSCFTGMAQRQRARLITARSHDRNVLPVFSNSQFSELPRCLHSTLITGVAQRLARGAHNSEVRCSNHLTGIFNSQFSELPRCLHSTLITGMAQGERAGLITPRSLVRSQFPVFSIRSFTETATLSIQQHTPAGVAQRKSA